MSKKAFLLLFVLPTIVYSSTRHWKTHTSQSNYCNSIDYVNDRTRTGNTRACSCPHPAFIAKHVLTRNLNVANHTFSADEREDIRERIRTTQTNLQSLFYAPDMVYRRHGHRCIFTRPATKWNCRIDNTEFIGWKCIKQGEKLAQHSVNTGHYYINAD